jgi:hypothetical protein
MCCVNPPYAMFPGWMVEPTTFHESKFMVYRELEGSAWMVFMYIQMQ